MRSKPKTSQTTVYLALPITDLLRLQELPSDDARVAALVVDMGVKLAGRPLSQAVLQLLGAIAHDRHRQGLFKGELPERHTLTLPPAPRGSEGVATAGAAGGVFGEGSSSHDGEGDGKGTGEEEEEELVEGDSSAGDTSADDEDYIAFV